MNIGRHKNGAANRPDISHRGNTLFDAFLKHNKDGALQIAANWNRQTLEKDIVDKTLLKHFFAAYPNALPKVQIVTAKNMESLSGESSEFRKKVRGETVGKLG